MRIQGINSYKDYVRANHQLEALASLPQDLIEGALFEYYEHLCIMVAGFEDSSAAFEAFEESLNEFDELYKLLGNDNEE